VVICFKEDFFLVLWIRHISWQQHVNIERNPVRAKMRDQAADYQWSSARYHLGLIDSDPLIQRKYKGIGKVEEWSKWLESDPPDLKELRTYFRVGRPYGGESFIRKAEITTGRSLFPRKPGRPPK
jgi:putative transposase